MVKTLPTWVSYAAMLLWLWSALLVLRATKFYLDRQKRLSVDDEAVRDYIIKHSDPEALADRIAEKVASRLRAEEKQRTRATLKELQELVKQMRTIAPAVRSPTQNQNGATKPRVTWGGKAR